LGGQETNARQQLKALLPEKTIQCKTTGEAELSFILIEESNSSDPNQDQAYTIKVKEEGGNCRRTLG